jgi:hypothetical protein
LVGRIAAKNVSGVTFLSLGTFQTKIGGFIISATSPLEAADNPTRHFDESVLSFDFNKLNPALTQYNTMMMKQSTLLSAFLLVLSSIGFVQANNCDLCGSPSALVVSSRWSLTPPGQSQTCMNLYVTLANTASSSSTW